MTGTLNRKRVWRLTEGPGVGTFILEAGWMSSVMDTLSCWSLLLTSLEQQMLTELRTCQELYSTKERLSMTSVLSAPLLRRLASFFGSITLRGSLSPAMADLSLPQQAGEGRGMPRAGGASSDLPEVNGTGEGEAAQKQPKSCHAAKAQYDKSLCHTCWEVQKGREREKGEESSEMLQVHETGTLFCLANIPDGSKESTNAH